MLIKIVKERKGRKRWGRRGGEREKERRKGGMGRGGREEHQSQHMG
jgi:hypothetical protein